MTPLRIKLEPEEIPTHGDNVVAGQLEDYDSPAAAIVESLKHLPTPG